LQPSPPAALSVIAARLDVGSNCAMEQAHHIEQRLTDLEIKASFTEDLVDQLNQIIVNQQLQIDLLIREVGHLRQQPSEGGSAPFRSLRDDLPPHY
jgi:SlyX protein